MPSGFSVEAEGTDLVIAALQDLQPTLAEKTVPVMQQAATMVAAEAEHRASARHVHKLWRSSGSHGRSIMPKYDVRHPGAYLFKVQTPGGAAGRAEAIAEFASSGITPQGGALVRNLNAAYGGTGRILWKAYDALAPQLQSDFESAVDAAAAEISARTS